MKLSARCRYAIRILIELAKHENKTLVSASMLSQKTGVSAQFVEQILKPLKQNGYTASRRGSTGGHYLAKPAERITFAQIVRLMEGDISLAACCGKNASSCPRKETCLARNVWKNVSKTLERELDSITLADLLHQTEVCPAKNIQNAFQGKETLLPCEKAL